MTAHGEHDELATGALEIHPRHGLVLAAGRPLGLSVREHALLLELARRADQVIPREVLHGLVWGGAMRPGDRSVDVYVHRLRCKLERALPEWRFIHTHVGFGYRFTPERPGEANASRRDGRSHRFHTPATAG